MLEQLEDYYVPPFYFFQPHAVFFSVIGVSSASVSFQLRIQGL